MKQQQNVLPKPQNEVILPNNRENFVWIVTMRFILFIFTICTIFILRMMALATNDFSFNVCFDLVKSWVAFTHSTYIYIQRESEIRLNISVTVSLGGHIVGKSVDIAWTWHNLWLCESHTITTKWCVIVVGIWRIQI